MNKVYLIPKYQVGAKTAYNAARGRRRRQQNDVAQGPRTLTMSPEERRKFEQAKRDELKRTHKKQYEKEYQKALQQKIEKERQEKERETRHRLEIGSNLIKNLKQQLDDLGVPYNPNASLGELYAAVLDNQEALTNYLHDGVYNPVFKRFDVTVKLPEEYKKFLDAAREENYYPGFMQDLEKYANYYRNQDVAGVLQNYSDQDVALNGPYLLDAAYAQMGESAGDWEHQAHNPEGIYYGDPDNYQKAMKSQYGKQMANRSSLGNIGNLFSPGQWVGWGRDMAKAGDFNPLMYLIPGYGLYEFATDSNVRQALWDSMLYGNSGWATEDFAFRHPQAATLLNIGLDLAVPWAIGKGTGLIARGIPRLTPRIQGVGRNMYNFLRSDPRTDLMVKTEINPNALTVDEMGKIMGGGDYLFSKSTDGLTINANGKIVRTGTNQRPTNKQMTRAVETVIDDYASIQERLPQDLQTEYNNILNGHSEMQQVKAAKQFNEKASAYIMEHAQDFDDVLSTKPSLAPRQTAEPTVTPNNPVTPESTTSELPAKAARPTEEAPARPAEETNASYETVEAEKPQSSTIEYGDNYRTTIDDDLSTEPSSQTGVPENNPKPAESGTTQQPSQAASSTSESSQAAPTESTPARSESAANGESASTSGNTGETSLDNPGQKYGLTKEQYEDYVKLSEKGGFRQRKLNRAEKLRYEDYEAKVKAVSQNEKPKLASKIKGITPSRILKGYGKAAAIATAVAAPIGIGTAAILAGKDVATGVSPGDRYKRAAKKAQMENEMENSKVNMEILNKTKELNKQAEDMQKQMEAMQPKDEIIGYEYDANGNIIGQQVKTANGNIKVIPIAPIDTTKVNQESKAYEGEFRQE